MRVLPPLDELVIKDRCGAIGPVDEIDGKPVILRCTLRDPDHESRHRNCRVYPDRKWAHEFELVQSHDGEITGSRRPNGDRRPGPCPGHAGHSAGHNGKQPTTAAAGHDPVDHLKQLAKADPARDTPPDDVHPDAQVCPDVDELTDEACRGWWDRSHSEIDTDLIHVCHKELEHPHEGRCRCICGTRRSGISYGPLPATARPEQSLEDYLEAT
jgi:hypothetical protein